MFFSEWPRLHSSRASQGTAVSIAVSVAIAARPVFAVAAVALAAVVVGVVAAVAVAVVSAAENFRFEQGSSRNAIRMPKLNSPAVVVAVVVCL